MSSAPQLGHFLEEGHPSKRDAIHVSVMSVKIMDREVRPGTRVGIRSDEDSIWVSRAYNPHVGIIDPFLDTTALSGDEVWLVMFPGTVKDLRHVWSHPAVPDESPIVEIKTEYVEQARC